MNIIDGRKLRDDILLRVKNEVATLPTAPVFCDVLVGNDPVSEQYVRMKKKMAESVGIYFHPANFGVSVGTDDLIKEIKILNNLPNMCGLIVQLPLPENIDTRAVLDAIDAQIDVDCLSTIASEKFYNGESSLGFPTALACMALLDSTGLELEGKNIAVLGQGMLVGRPVAALLNFRGLKPVAITSKTENKMEIIKNADVIISGIGKGKFITGDMIKTRAVLIDAGTSESSDDPTQSTIVGDVDLESVSSVASLVSPVPGGVGPVTVAMLLRNVLEVAKSKIK